MRFLIDEDMHRSIAIVLQELGHDVLDSRDVGLRGKSDQAIFKYAQEHQAVILTADLDFGDTVEFPLGGHYGIVLIRFPNEMSTTKINEQVRENFASLKDQEVPGNLIVISPGKVRIRKK